MVIDKRDILATSVRNVEELKRRYELDKETKEMDLSDYLKNDVFPITVANGGTGGQAFTSGSYLIGNGAEAVQEKTPQQVADDVRAYVQPDLSGYSLKPTLLWSNASPTSSFGEQTITLANTSYDIIVIRFRWSGGDNGGAAPLVCIKGVGQNGASSHESNRVQRYATYNANGTVSFSVGIYNGSSNNYYCIPTQIWGI